MKVDAMQIKCLARMGQIRAFFGIGLLETVKETPNLYVVSADLSRYSGLSRFARKYPDKVVNVGIAEQQMVNIAAGLAMEGNIVYAGSYAAFATARAMEQIKHNMSALNQNVKLVGFNAGYSMKSLGISHWATEDISMTRCLPNMTVISPADSLEAVKVCIALAKKEGPAYIRLCGSGESPVVYNEDYSFVLGKGIVLKEGKDAVIFCHGRMVTESLKAADILSEKKIEVEVVNIHTLKPLDRELIEQELNNHSYVFVVEEHNVTGGLGSAVAEVIAEYGKAVKFKRTGMNDCFYKLGAERYIWAQAGLTREAVAHMVINSLEEEG